MNIPNKENEEIKNGENMEEGIGKKESTETEEGNVIEEWDQIKQYPIQDLFSQGYRPYKHPSKTGKFYISLKKGRHEVSLGLYTDERWNLLRSMMPEKMNISSFLPNKKETIVEGKRERKNILATEVSRPPVIPTRFTPSLDTIYYFKLVQNYGYEKSFEDFVNETVKAYFLRNGLVPGLILTVEEEGKD